MKLRRPGDVARLGLMASAAIVLFVFESLAPRPLPWMKLGLGNLPVLVSLLSFGSGPALAVSAARRLIASSLDEVGADKLIDDAIAELDGKLH